MSSIVLNCDCGEGEGDDAAILPHVGAANIACGGHAGDEATMRQTLRLCQQFGVSAGAHPGYPDRPNFGRVVLTMMPDQVEAAVREQIETLASIARDEGVALTHVKPHGALYNYAATHRDVADVIARVVAAIDPNLVFVGLAGSQLIEAGRAHGLRVANEAFADRAYEADGALRSRNLSGAVIEDDTQALTQVLRIAREGHVISHDGERVPVRADTICLHGDTPGAAQRAAFLHNGLEVAGITPSRFVRRCPECGAPLKAGQSCSAFFDECLMLEFNDPNFGVVHHLTVPAYHLQHPSRLSRSGWFAVRQTLHEFVIGAKSPAEMRLKNSVAFSAANKAFSLKRGDRLTLPPDFRWARTIASVRLSDADDYCDDVRRWAEAILTDAMRVGNT